MCFSFAALINFLIWAVCVGGALYILRLLVAFILPKIGFPIAGEVVTLLTNIITVLIWIAVIVFLLIFVGDIIICLASSGGGFPRLRG